MRQYVTPALQALAAVFGDDIASFAVRLWDGTTLPATGSPAFTLVVNAPGALRAAFRPPVDLNAGRAFAAGLLDVEGDIEAAVDAMIGGIARSGIVQSLRVASALRRLPAQDLPELREARLHGKRHSLERDRAAIGFHYDMPVEFYQTFLDSRMVYSCAYWDEGVSDVDGAQLAKLDYTLRKLRLKPGERLLDIGCGWGAMVIRAAQQFGVRAVGVTLSERQYEEAQRRIAAAGLENAAEVRLLDYRELNEEFDKIVSVGMFEHVGRAHLPEYFAKAFALLREGGLFLNHGIASETPGAGAASGFMDKFIFPDGELVHISEALRHAENAGFEVRDVENLREHYHRTLQAWIGNIERNRDRAAQTGGDQSYRAWRLYLAGSAQGFRSRRMSLFQSLLAKVRPGGVAEIPATRRDLYR